MTAGQWWGLFLGVPPVLLTIAAIAAWLLREKVAGVVFWALRTYPALWREAAAVVFPDLLAGDPLGLRIEGQEKALERFRVDYDRESRRLELLIREDLAPLAALGPKLTALDTSVQLLTAETRRNTAAVEKLPELITTVAVLKQQVESKPSRGSR